MKVAAASIAGFLRQLPPAIAGVLIYGADEGLVRERAGSLSSTILGGADDDPFRVVYLTPEQIRQDPARLGDETQSLSLMGGRRVIRIKEASDSLAPILQDVIARPHGMPS
jgi:DNA polymerase-3 subunit delta